eukprot:762741-Hanusia_phi.AAC.3
MVITSVPLALAWKLLQHDCDFVAELRDDSNKICREFLERFNELTVALFTPASFRNHSRDDKIQRKTVAWLGAFDIDLDKEWRWNGINCQTSFKKWIKGTEHVSDESRTTRTSEQTYSS